MFFKVVINKNFIENKAKYLLGLAIIVYLVFFVWLTLKKYYLFAYNVGDLAIFNQLFFNIIHGQWYANSIAGGNFFGYHFSPIVFILVPIYSIYQAPPTLLVLQTLFFALAAWPIFLLAKKIIGSQTYGLVLALLWLLNPFVYRANLYEFHLFSLAVLLIFWCLYFYYQNNFKLYLLFFTLALLAREDVIFVLLAFAFLAFLDKKSKRWSWGSLFLCLVYFFISITATKLLSQDKQYVYFVYYTWLGGHDLGSILWAWLKSPLKVLAHLFSFNNWQALVFIFSPVLFLPFLKPKYLLLAGFIFLQYALTAGGLTMMIASGHYLTLVLPGVFLSLIFVGKMFFVRQPFPFSWLVYSHQRVLKFCFFILILYFAINNLNQALAILKTYPQDYHQSRQKILANIPTDSSVLASANVMAPLSNRADLYNVDYAYFGITQFNMATFKQPRVDYIFIDQTDLLNTIAEGRWHDATVDITKSPSHWRSLLAQYNLVEADNGLLLYQNKDLGGDISVPLYETGKPTVGPDKNNFLADNQLQLVGSQMLLKLTLPATSTVNDYYLIRFYQGKKHFDLPLDYGLLAADDWSSENSYSFYFYLDQNIEAYQIFSWQGYPVLGPAFETEVAYQKLEARSDKMKLK